MSGAHIEIVDKPWRCGHPRTHDNIRVQSHYKRAVIRLRCKKCETARFSHRGLGRLQEWLVAHPETAERKAWRLLRRKVKRTYPRGPERARAMRELRGDR